VTITLLVEVVVVTTGPLDVEQVVVPNDEKVELFIYSIERVDVLLVVVTDGPEAVVVVVVPDASITMFLLLI
jgi:hypothetical protein